MLQIRVNKCVWSGSEDWKQKLSKTEQDLDWLFVTQEFNKQ